MDDTVLYAEAGAVATITLNRPDRLNAMNDDLLQQWLAALERAADRDEVRVVVVTGTGRAFCVGGDLTGGAGGGVADAPTLTGRVGNLRHYGRISQLLHDMPKITIAAVNGACAGAGLSVACAADLRYAADSAVFNTAFLTVAVSGDFGGTWTLPRLVGPARARELYLLTPRVNGEEAVRLGLVSAVFPASELMPRVGEVAERLAESAPRALASIKANLNEALEASFADHLDREVRRHVECMLSKDGEEGAAAFLEKRAPNFTGA